jgi:transposase
MENQLSNRSKDWREGRRFRAWELKEKGWRQQRIAEALGVTKGAVSQWLKKAKTGGVETLRHRKGTGAPSRLTPIQKSELLELLSKGAESYGFRGEIWTCERVAEVIRWHYGVSYHPSHISRILESLRWSLQKPKRKAKQRNEDEIREWLEKKWPEIKKKGKRRIAQ